ncbi:DUF2325 domain-containing protein [Staphylococcus muscae]|uniref:Uncharacterized protein conserved in bacteria (DUF2325) n=2 Tax=Staphylococcus muscae TaxID=1294 RepID=A0A240BW13_9STAP|nr:DUF2325 domain-containing protein [Staphylococcus muscae]GGA85739.1 hypothetical protein GCM10007183_07410 [Staphylococcus muscae]SNV99078.1 Uncharacterized protein conserved in bacteria (DUF2325) [Staphylococcus muscae]
MDKDMKDKIVTLIKEAWIEDIKNNREIKKIEKQNKHYIKVLKHLEQLVLSDEVCTDRLIEKSTDNIETKKQEDTFIFVRHLLGGEGIHPETGEKIFVPESVVRNEMLEHGDRLTFEEHGNGYQRHKYHKLNGEKDQTIAALDIISYDYAIVDYDESIHRYVCKKYFKQGELTSIPICLLNEKDIIKFNIRKEDIISIAQTANHTTSRIRWKYDADEILPTPIKKKASYYKEHQEQTEMEDAEKAIFKGIAVGIFGASQFINNYIEEVEQRGGKVHHTESDSQCNVEAVVNKSDIIVIPITHISHVKAEQAKGYAKKSEKPFVILKNSGRSHFVSELKGHLHLIQSKEE